MKQIKEELKKTLDITTIWKEQTDIDNDLDIFLQSIEQTIEQI